MDTLIISRASSKKIVEAEILFYTTPIWWNNHFSEIQRVIERLNMVSGMINEGRDSPTDGKFGGVIFTGDRIVNM